MDVIFIVVVVEIFIIFLRTFNNRRIAASPPVLYSHTGTGPRNWIGSYEASRSKLIEPRGTAWPACLSARNLGRHCTTLCAVTGENGASEANIRGVAWISWLVEAYSIPPSYTTPPPCVSQHHPLSRPTLPATRQGLSRTLTHFPRLCITVTHNKLTGLTFVCFPTINLPSRFTSLPPNVLSSPLQNLVGIHLKQRQTTPLG